VPEFFDFVGTGPLLAIVTIVVVALLASYVASRYRVANANEALIVAGSRGAKVRDERGELAATTGRDDKGIRVVVGGGTFVLPLVHKVGRLKLTARQIGVALPDAVTSQGIKVAVQGVATFKIGRDVESIRNAAERFLDAKDEQVDSIVKNVLEGSLRSIVGTLTIEELIMDRQKLLQQVQDSAKGDLATSGLQIDAFTIQSIADESGYIDLLGRQKLAVVERDARMAHAAADQEAAVREAEAEQIKVSAQRDVELRRADVLTQTAAAQARAGQAGPLAQAEAQQEVIRRQTELADLEAARKQKELLAATIRPAEADAEAAVRRAEGERQARIAAAQAEAERARLAGEAEARVTIAKGEAQARIVSVSAEAEAHRVAVEGNAEAQVTLTKGEAEAKALALRAEAYKQFNEAAVIQTVLSELPEIVRAAAEPMGRIGSLTVLSSDGASEVVRTTTRTVAEAGAAVKGLTGLDVPGLIGQAMAGRLDGAPGGPRPEGEPAEEPADAAPRGRSSATAGTARARPEPAEAFAQAVETIKSAPGSAAALAEPTGDALRATPSMEEPRLDISPETAPDDAASLLAEALRRVPGIGRYGGTTLNDLGSRGPRIARALWQVARPRIAERYGDLTVGQLFSRFASETSEEKR
jgi:flotillin